MWQRQDLNPGLASLKAHVLFQSSLAGSDAKRLPFLGYQQATQCHLCSHLVLLLVVPPPCTEGGSMALGPGGPDMPPPVLGMVPGPAPPSALCLISDPGSGLLSHHLKAHDAPVADFPSACGPR